MKILKYWRLKIGAFCAIKNNGCSEFNGEIIKIIRKYFELSYNENIYENWVVVTSVKMEE